MALMRWREVVRALQEAAVLGAFGDGLRLNQLGDGSLQLVEDVPVVENGFAHTLAGNKLYPVLADFEGMPVTVGAGTSADDPPVFLELSEDQMTGPTVGYVWTSRADPALDWNLPAELRLSLDLPETESDGVVFVKPVLLIRYGQVLTLEL